LLIKTPAAINILGKDIMLLNKGRQDFKSGKNLKLLNAEVY
jgi:hypothetical protein